MLLCSPDVIVALGGRVDGGVLGVREPGVVHAIFLAVDQPLLRSLLAAE